MTLKSILVAGATGYMCVYPFFSPDPANHPWLRDIEITALVRKKSEAEVIEASGVKTIICASYDDAARLETIGQDFDIIIQAGHNDARTAIPLIRGLSARKAKCAIPVHFLHVTGASNISDRPLTQHYTETRVLSDQESIYHYMKYRESIESYGQRKSDIMTIEAGKQYSVSTYTVMAPTIFGIGSGEFRRYTTQLFSHREYSQRLADVSHEMGYLDSPTVREAGLDEVAKGFTNGNRLIAELSYGANALMTSELGPALGWVPKYLNEAWEASFMTELKGFLRDRPELIQMPPDYDIQKPARFSLEESVVG
ncbi:nad dependent epimerase dehydratase family protein [Stemphylium lycopersici]|uniref:NAD dependent epimerase/dehydratase family protein n=1 Tax=Stemphylium lycopersici TaxID=183478 RepID=A0A364N6G8_STELY|nr:nad dependent epimerase dehydratase family protein [Stemphylium lycopersici]RAR12827.1 NAD dependent epimerase/dehydratase family protein [Stemphylium lycopersici]